MKNDYAVTRSEIILGGHTKIWATYNRNIANMAADGTNSAVVVSFSFCFGGHNTIGHRFLHLAFVTGIKLWWSADGTTLPATFAIPVR